MAEVCEYARPPGSIEASARLSVADERACRRLDGLSDSQIDYLCDGGRVRTLLSIEIINRCNVRCRMCRGAISASRNGHRPLSVMSPDEARALLGGLRVDTVTMAGGYSEPLLNTHVVEIVRVIKTLGSKAQIISNGTCLNELTSRGLIDAGLDKLVVSCHGARKETAEFVMPGSKFDEIIGNLERLRQLKRELNRDKPRLELTMVLMKCNLDDVMAMVDVARRVRASLFLNMMMAPAVSQEQHDETGFVQAQNLYPIRESVRTVMAESLLYATSIGVQMQMGPTLRYLVEQRQGAA